MLAVEGAVKLSNGKLHHDTINEAPRKRGFFYVHFFIRHPYPAMGIWTRASIADEALRVS